MTACSRAPLPADCGGIASTAFSRSNALGTNRISRRGIPPYRRPIADGGYLPDSGNRSGSALVGRSPWTWGPLWGRRLVPLPEAEAGASARARAPAPLGAANCTDLSQADSHLADFARKPRWTIGSR